MEAKFDGITVRYGKSQLFTTNEKKSILNKSTISTALLNLYGAYDACVLHGFTM